MKQRWQKLAARVDALSLRERVLVFAALVATILFAAYFVALGPLLREQATLRAKISQQQNNLAGMDAEITQKLRDYERDPDAAERARLGEVRIESARLGESLSAMQKGLVAPERMAPLIDTILRANGRLKLVSMRTLPVSSLNDAPADPAQAPRAEPKPDTATKLQALQKQVADSMPRLPVPGDLHAAAVPAQPAASARTQPLAPASAVAPKPGSLLYRHGVEITVRGNYLDMIDYMNALESLPTQLFWGGAKLEVEDYPTSRLTLTMYTLSLDPKWLKL
jgi:MSHA biogenesis protein MshJ